MARIIGIDYGLKRTGLATTDPEQIIVQAIDTVDTRTFLQYLDDYLARETVEKIVFGLPRHTDRTLTHVGEKVQTIASRFQRKYPGIQIDFADEDFSSVDAKEVIIKSGIGKKKRRNKALVDKVSAVIILQRYLGHIP